MVVVAVSPSPSVIGGAGPIQGGGAVVEAVKRQKIVVISGKHCQLNFKRQFLQLFK